MLRARLEFAIGVIFAGAALSTLIWPTWIERLTGLEPDAGTGEAEWLLVVAFGVAALASAMLSRRHYLTLRSTPTGSSSN
jgi:hypothetical protein